MKIRSVDELQSIRDEYLKRLEGYKYHILVCGGAGCVSSGCQEVSKAVQQALEQHKLQNQALVMETGCIGTCAVGPVMLIQPEGVFYTKLTPESAREIVVSHLVKGKILKQHTFYDQSLRTHVPKIDDINFFKEQVKIALRNCGAMEYARIEAYIARDGYLAAAKALTGMSGAEIVKEIKASGLMGRGGAGFPTGVKWDAGLRAPGPVKYIVCNADEGDPGAFMDRSIIEGDPHTVIEGMLVGGFTIGAHQGYVYVRAEYPLAIERLEKALDQGSVWHRLRL
jgi:NADH-quinone oxidoreductase subunit F